MLRKIALYALLLPLALVLILFAVANRGIVTVSFDPFDSAQPALSVKLPLFILIFIFLTLGVMLGGFAAWLRQSHHRRTARALRGDLAGLRHEVEILNARLDEPAGNEAPRVPARVSNF